MAFYVGKYLGVEQKEYDVEVITPMFLAGADKNKAELRVPSIKGMLRFWWRATCGIDDIEDMKKLEDEIFGSTDKKASFSISINQDFQTSKDLFSGKKFSVSSKGRTFQLDILHYLAFGCVTYNKEKRGNIVDKEYIKPASNFRLSLNANKKIIDEIEMVLTHFINFGGLGAKSRNGFGSLNCKDTNLIKQNKNGNLKKYSSFSKEAKKIIFPPKDSWQNALSDIGLAYREARLSLENRHYFEKRGLIAMPIEAKGEIIPIHIKDGRHSKPYFLHVNKTTDNKFQGQILFMPYQYFIDSKTYKDYEDVCKKMNQEIEKMAGGNKWQ